MNKAFLFALSGAVFGGSVPVLAKVGLEVFPPHALNITRFFFGSVALFPFVLPLFRTGRGAFLKLIFTSLVGVANPLFLFIALTRTNASVAPIIYASVPIMAALYAFYKKTVITHKQWAGISIGFVGVLMIALLPIIESGSSGDLLGNLFIFLAAVSFFAYSELSRSVSRKHTINPLLMTFFFTTVTMMVSLVLGGRDIISIQPESIQPRHLIAVVLNGVVGTALFYAVYQKSLQLHSTLAASLFVYIQPIATVLMAFVFLGERITPLFVLGGTLAILGSRIAATPRGK